MNKGRVGEERGGKETGACPLTIHERRGSGFNGIMLVPFVDSVFDKPTRNAAQGKLSIGKYNLSLWVPLHFSLVI
jgi:hypothetical protein